MATVTSVPAVARAHGRRAALSAGLLMAAADGHADRRRAPARTPPASPVQAACPTTMRQPDRHRASAATAAVYDLY